MPSKTKPVVAAPLVGEWAIPAAASLGSEIRCKGILNDIRARLPLKTRKSLGLEGRVLALRMPEPEDEEAQRVAGIVGAALAGVEDLPVIPRELEDILAIRTTERHRWLKDGRLQSAGTRTVKLYGRAKKITFHVFDHRRVEEILNADLVESWREDDAIAAVENRRRAAATRALTRARKTAPSAAGKGAGESTHTGLQGWEEFEREVLLR